VTDEVSFRNVEFKKAIHEMTGRIILVTGANRGIGLACVGTLSKMPDVSKVLLAARQLHDATAAATPLGAKVQAVQLDLSTADTRKRDVANILSAHLAIDALINNAGVLENGSLLEVDDAKLKHSIEVNFEAPLHLIRLFAPVMVKRGYGRIVNVSSGWGSFAEGLTGPAAYSISKAALNAVTLVASQSLPPIVKINSCCPGWVRTRMGGSSASRSVEEGADTPVWLATLPDAGPTGGFFRDKKKIAW
jgi:NAD(P)-dependent dehydrogenase (short-subunit alcohol dehydrogenase family)